MLNNISIAGRITKTPELKYTNTNKAVLSFCIAVEEDFGENKNTDFIDCVAWNKTAEFISRYFDRGDMIILSGRLKTSTWEDQNGNKRKDTKVWVSNTYFGGGKRKDPEPQASEPMPPTPPPVDYDPRAVQEVDKHELPFMLDY